MALAISAVAVVPAAVNVPALRTGMTLTGTRGLTIHYAMEPWT
jgi:hypothetical protein